MLINTSITIAFKCKACGAFEFNSLSIFKLACNKQLSLACHCGKSYITISKVNNRQFIAVLGCIGCGNEHTFTFNGKDSLFKQPYIFECPQTGTQLCFIGCDDEVGARVDKLEKELDELIDMFGYDSYFSNTRVMLDSLNRVHDIAEQGSLFCECGNTDIDLVMLSDRIDLRCKKCFGRAVINAASNEDLKNTLKLEQIVLVADEKGSNTLISRQFIRKTGKRYKRWS